MLLLLLPLLVLPPAVEARIGLGSVGVDDATTLWQGTWEARVGVDAGAGYDIEGSRADVFRFPVSLRYGWRERLEIGFGAPFAFQRSDDYRLDGSGLSDIAMALKYQMSRDEGSAPASSTELRVGYGFNNAVSSDAWSIGVIYALTKVFSEGRSAGHLNLGYTIFTAQRQDVLMWGLGYERRVGDAARLSLGANSGTQMIPGVRKDIMAELGLAYEIGSATEFSISGGAGLTKESPDWQVRLGVLKEFGRAAGTATSYRMTEWGLPPDPTAAEMVHDAEAAMTAQDYELAISYYRESIAKDSTLPAAWNNLGTAYYRLGRDREAIEAYESAARLAPASADIPYNIGLAYYRLGDIQNARRAFARALQADPGHTRARSSLLSLGGRPPSP